MTIQYGTIRQTAATGILPEHRLRLMLKAGELPGFYAGNRFMVDMNQLVTILAEKSRSELSAPATALADGGGNRGLGVG